ncbi:glycosyltransferase family 2 protein [Sulfitobacter sp.]|uniref:glycosyltransferase family 2 protein n=1 Tax=Sulfitobacter sp. TaxID=1903071 RepID=UPI003F6C1090
MNIQPLAPMRISVVIPHLNQPDQLRRCLASLRAGRRPPDEVIVVDNGSVRLPETVCAEFEPVILLHQPLAGPGLARNLGIAQARGDVLAFIDADCIADPDWLWVAERQMRDKTVQIIGGNVRIAYDDPNRLTALEAYESVFAYRMDRYIAREGFTGTGNLVMRSSVFEKVGVFRGLEVAEDREWGQRATGMGYVISYVPDLIVFHPARASFAALRAKWDRQLAHDRGQCGGTWGNLKWGLKAAALILSPLAEVPRIASSERIKGLRNRALAFGVLGRIRLYRAMRMAQLLAGMDPDYLLQRWNLSDAH